MPQRMNKSLILLFKSDPLERGIDTLRETVAASFGGGAVLELPIHVTIFKWAAPEVTADLLSSLRSFEVDMTVDLGQPVLSQEHGAVWYEVHSTKLTSLYDRAGSILDTFSIPKTRRQPKPHLTIAYENYDIDSLKQILSFVQVEGSHLSGSLSASRLSIASADTKGVWRLVEK